MNNPSHKKVYFISLGCDKNFVDSEKTLGLLTDAGYTYTDQPLGADVIIINTCCFIKDALDESIHTLIDMAAIKAERRIHPPELVVMGCMAERYRKEISEEFPEVDVIVGTNSWQDIVDILDRGEETKRDISENVFVEKPVNERILTEGGHYAYLKIAEGCDKNCTYCVIPAVRGRFRSVPMEDLIAEARGLVRNGVKELILVAQETTLYGIDLYGKKSLARLLKELNTIEYLRWIRVMYCYPEEIDEELIGAVRDLGKVLKYLDIPVQSASDHILRRMGRKTKREELKDRIKLIRDMIPDIVLRTTLISGFPGETSADHDLTMDFVREIQFDRLGVFEYSREEGTKAAGFSHQVPARVKASRKDELMCLQREISAWRNKRLIGRSLDVIIEGRIPDTDDGDNVYVGRTYMDAPDVDGYIYLKSPLNTIMTGDFVRASVTGASEYDLIGEIV